MVANYGASHGAVLDVVFGRDHPAGRVPFDLPSSMDAAIASRSDVPFDTAGLDQQRRSGWSIVVQGRAAAVGEPAEMVRLWTVAGLEPWAPGIRNVFIQITPRRISGRLLGRDPGSNQPPERVERQ